METLSLLFACATIILAILYIRKLKRQINNVEKAFKKLSMLYYEIKKDNKNESIVFKIDETFLNGILNKQNKNKKENA